MIRTLLIANRGEIAIRIAATARRMGIRSVAVYSDADRQAAHVAACDAAIAIGPSPARESYLRIDAILDAARRENADAIHPGYGFLSESAEFAASCIAAGLIFVGPSEAAIRAMGSKSEAKRRMAAAGVPLVPGYHGDAQDVATLSREAAQIGFPVLLKAALGGGGKGIRLVETAEAMPEAIDITQREALASFGDRQLLIEKAILRPRHVEVQIFGDHHGNVVHLFTRDCSLQRRHQKVIEEAPAPDLDATTRQILYEAAIAAGRAIAYVGAGTVEFLLGADGTVYFLEMNTRLQVEHPVTEAITGLDLVEWQLRVASGEALPLAQTQISCTGHAVEARLYAEDPTNQFLPSTGTLLHLGLPHGIRIDSGVRQGDRITGFYDPMIAKLIVHAAHRSDALARLAGALDAVAIEGVRSNAGFLGRLARDPDVAAMEIDTDWIEREFIRPSSAPAAATLLPILAIVHAVASRPADATSWGRSDGWRSNLPNEDIVELVFDGKLQRHAIDHDEDVWRIDGHVVRPLAASRGEVAAEIDGMIRRAVVVARDDGWVLLASDARLVVEWRDRAASSRQVAMTGSCAAPMPGTIVSLDVAVGDHVARGATLLVLEAMKVHLPMHAPSAGRVAELFVALGDQVAEGAILVRIEDDAARPSDTERV